MADPPLLKAAVLAPLVVGALALGGVHRETQAVLWLLVAGTALAALRGRPGRWVLPAPVAWFALAVMGATALHLVPLPPSVLGFLSPTIADWKAFLWEAPPGGPAPDPGAWRCLALAPQEVAVSLVAQGSYLLWFMLVLRVFSAGQAAAPLWTVAVVGLLCFGIALGHEVLDATRVLGVYELRDLSPYPFMSTFANANFQAGFYAMAGLVALGLARGPAAGGARALAILAATASFAGVCLTLSRGGILMVLPALATWLLLTRRAGEPGRPAFLVVVAVAVGTLCAALWLDSSGLDRTLAQTLDAGAGPQAAKWQVWGPAARLVGDFWATGVGQGGFRHAFDHAAPDLTEHLSYTAPENWPLHLAADYGVPAAVVIAALGARAFVGAVGSLRLTPVAAGAATSVVYALLHDLFDFSLTAPGAALPVVAAVAFGWSARAQGRGDGAGAGGGALPTPAVLALALLTAAGAAYVWSSRDQTLDDDRRALRDQANAKAPDDVFDPLFASIRERRPADYPIYWLKAEQVRRTGDGRSRAAAGLFYVNRSLFLRPAHAPSHFLAGELLREAGRGWQADLEYRLAVRHAPDADRQRQYMQRRIDAGAPLAGLMALTGDDVGIQARLLPLLLKSRGPAAAYAAVAEMSLEDRAAGDAIAEREVANVLLAAGRKEALRALVDGMVRRHPNAPETWYWAAMADRAEGDERAALVNVRRARLLSTGTGRLGEMVECEARVLRALRDLPGLTDLLAWTRRSPEHLADVYAHRAALRQELGDVPGAIADWREALVLRPEWVGPRLALADLLAGQGRRREALRLADEALQRAPADPAALKARALLATPAP